MATHSSTLVWKIPWMEGPGGLQSMGSLGVGHDWATSLFFSLSCIGEGNGNPLQCSCLENPRDGVAWWAAVYWVTQCRTRLKRLSSSSSDSNIKIVSLHWKTVWQFLIKLSVHLSHNPTIVLSGINSKEMKTCACVLILSVMSDSLRPYGR